MSGEGDSLNGPFASSPKLARSPEYRRCVWSFLTAIPNRPVDCPSHSWRKSSLASAHRTELIFKKRITPKSVRRCRMIFVLVLILVLFCVGILVHRYRSQERQKDLLWMKRHADDYQQAHKSPW